MAAAARATAPPIRRIGILGPYSSRNFGDTAIQMAVIDGVRRRFPDHELIGICPDPADTVRTHGVGAFPVSGDHADPGSGVWKHAAELPERWRGASGALGGAARFLIAIPGRLAALTTTLRRLWRIYRFTRDMDLLLIAGSGQIDDYWGGPWRQPFWMLAWSSACRLRGAAVVVFAVGVDLLTTSLGKRFAFAALNMAGDRVLRDQGSVDALRSAGFRATCRVCPDPAFGLDLERGTQRASTVDLMVCPISHRAWPSGPADEYQRYLRELGDAVESLARSGLVVRVASSQTDLDGPVAERFAQDLRERLGTSARVELARLKTVQEYVAAAQAARVVIASRLHAAILAMVAGTPVVAISYIRKVTQLMSDVGLEAFCLPLPGIQADRIRNAVETCIAGHAAINWSLGARVEGFRASLAGEYESLGRLLPRA